ncbi:MAG: preprotein translocase subunit SecE [Candidatus Gracilibacteria bacterium]|nr:preprotein translocase subunit SecE [Candidatus Gracilibacteria bacterium]MDD3120182.1 preprotein translocase subunit SecE [Candidatus Gracilibacteria bacterium]MDD4531008.1 preprotein translocase subunit SecE [Candidatus Gracilibacteria bacterium]
MLKFFKESLQELEHVVRPTQKETKKYFYMVTYVIIALGLFLFLVSSFFSFSLYAIKDAVKPSGGNTTNVNNNTTPLKDINLGTGKTSNSTGTNKEVIPSINNNPIKIETGTGAKK